MTGYVPSLEAFTFVATEAEEGQAWLKGRRQVPLGFGWLDPGDPPFDELPMQVNRIAYREFSRDPDLSLDSYRRSGGGIFMAIRRRTAGHAGPCFLADVGSWRW